MLFTLRAEYSILGNIRPRFVFAPFALIVIRTRQIKNFFKIIKEYLFITVPGQIQDGTSLQL